MNDRDPRERKLTTADIADAGSRQEVRRPEDDPNRFQRPEVRQAPMPPQPPMQAHPENEPMEALFPGNEAQEMKSHWKDIQTSFVDEPQRSVKEADALVASAIKRLADSFADARSKLEGQWARGGDVSTEDLRVALRRYRSFFDRLLAV
jgi:hypothetical protein